jgi:excisionase family DNA binding protein
MITATETLEYTVRTSLKDLESWLSSHDVAERLSISRTTAVKLATEGHIRAVKTRIGWLFDPAAVEEYARRSLRS